ncbi:uncharacterized protein LOC130626095 [Hydractinia symbiolongicarpus]|uniref:uncharacterized protein LOC130626095 n=1 Tax=Hydractinia symbiolongicarpus TaxID=13093 RepID=UPI00254F6BA0|nr:uncharacterized protein LOC130626095 [Hydractinia symbiolongicarpus]
MISKINSLFFMLFFVAVLNFSYGKPQCGMRWRSPCAKKSMLQRGFKRERSRLVVPNDLLDEIEREASTEESTAEEEEAKRINIIQKEADSLFHRNLVEFLNEFKNKKASV